MCVLFERIGINETSNKIDYENNVRNIVVFMKKNVQNRATVSDEYYCINVVFLFFCHPMETCFRMYSISACWVYFLFKIISSPTVWMALSRRIVQILRTLSNAESVRAIKAIIYGTFLRANELKKNTFTRTCWCTCIYTNIIRVIPCVRWEKSAVKGKMTTECNPYR